jgi:hypothetical protein
MCIEGREERGAKVSKRSQLKSLGPNSKEVGTLGTYSTNSNTVDGFKESSLVCSAVTSVHSHRVGHVRHGWFILPRMRPWVNLLGPLDWGICCITLGTDL